MTRLLLQMAVIIILYTNTLQVFVIQMVQINKLNLLNGSFLVQGNLSFLIIKDYFIELSPVLLLV